jgi:mRNA interferase MazF
VKRGEIWLAVLDPTVGSEIRKTRPCVIVAPMTTAGHPAPYRVPIVFEGKRGLIVLDQIRTLDKKRLVKRLGKASPRVFSTTLQTLRDVFAD